MPLVEIHQFGGGEGSHSGDCCLVHIGSSPPSWCVIDLGTAANSDAYRNTQCERALGVLRKKAKTSGRVIITHWHADHTGGKRHGYYLKALGCSQPIGTLRAAALGKADESALASETKQNGRQLLEVDLGQHILTLQLIYPDFRLVAKHPKPDENLCSLGALLTLWEKVSRKPVFSFLSMGDMHPINEHQALAVVGERPIHLLKFPHHGSKSNYFPKLFAQILQPGGCHVIISGYTRGESQSLKQLCAHGAASVTLLLQDAEKTRDLLDWDGYKVLAKKHGLRAWKDAFVSIDTSKGAAYMTGLVWSPGKKFGDYATLGDLAIIDLTKGGSGPELGLGFGLGLGDDDDAQDAFDAWQGWQHANGALRWKENRIVGVSYDDVDYVLVPTEGGGQCFYRCCARYVHNDPSRCDEVRQQYAATLQGGERARVAQSTAFATFEDIEGMARQLGIPIEVHLSPMADRDQKVNRRRRYNAASSALPLHVLFEYNPLNGEGHISTLQRVE